MELSRSSPRRASTRRGDPHASSCVIVGNSAYLRQALDSVMLLEHVDNLSDAQPCWLRRTPSSMVGFYYRAVADLTELSDNML